MTQPDPSLPTSPELERLREKVAAAKDAAANASATVNTSAGVAVRVDAAGKLAGLTLTAQALRNGPNTLAQMIVDACQRADSKRVDALRAAYADLDNDPAVQDARAVTEAFLGIEPTESARLPVSSDDPDATWVDRHGGSIYERW